MAEILLYNECFTETFLRIKDQSVDVVCIDPPYLYLKNQKLEREFDEDKFFVECKRVLKKNGFIIMFGRGYSFYRWNCILSNLGFTFKEEVIWDKQHTSSPVLPIGRVHETISILCKGKGKINNVKVPYTESKGYDLSKMIDDINRIKTAFNNSEHFDDIQKYLVSRKREDYHEERLASKHGVTFGTKRLGKRILNPVQAIIEGMKEKSIIRNQRNHYTSIHPTEKPVKLLERLLNLVIPTDKDRSEILVADFFGGSYSTMEACYNLGVNGISCEIDNEYHNLGKKRIDQLTSKPKLF